MGTVTLKPEFVLEGIDQFNQHYKQIMDYGFTKSEIEKVKTKMLQSFKTRVIRESAPSASGMMNQINQDFYYGNKIIPLKSELNLLEDNFTKIDSLVLLKELKNTNQQGSFKYLLSANSKLVENLPKDSLLLSHIRNRDSITVLPYKNNMIVPNELLGYIPTPGKIEDMKLIPEIGAKKIYLDNGAKVIYKKTENAEDKIIISGFKQGGYYALDSTDYVKSMYVSPIVSISGYGDFSREALSDYLTGNSAKVQLLLDRTRAGFSGSANNMDVNSLFKLFYLKSVHPRVDTTLFNQVKERMLKSLDNKEVTAKDKFYEELKFLIRGEDYTTRQQTVKQIQEDLAIESVKPIYDRFFGVADDYIITVLTDQELPAILPLITTYIGGLPKGNVSNDYEYNPRPVLKKPTSLIKNTGVSPKSIVSLVYQQNKVERDIPKLQIENNLLESILKIKYTERLREDLGVVYGVGVSISSTKHPVPLSRQTISLVCDPKDVNLIKSEIRKIIEGIVNGDINIEQDLMKVKNNLIKNHRLKKQSNSYWTRAIRDYYYNGYRNWNFTYNYEKMVQDVTIRRLKKKAKTYFIKTPEIKAILHPKP
ncbi:M16 family metallopeptidase [Arenibacter latericius]|uniref:M16 family metallopeptidase n=1 Tax=Arenibacter latericius TaxID=86104 RepID=UPI0003F9C826|nr:insulinase family protein [Arenibacter latericius]